MVSPSGKVGWESRLQRSVSKEERQMDVGKATKPQRFKTECQTFLVKTKFELKESPENSEAPLWEC